jgi:hypothetical protein
MNPPDRPADPLDAEMLSRLIYASSVDVDLRTDELNRLLEHARAHNEQRGVTGLLVYDSQHFLQLIEGSRSSLNALYKSLLKDPRHRDVQLLKFARIDARRFPDWSMGFVPSDLAHRTMTARRVPLSALAPDLLDGESAEALLVAFGSATAGRAATLSAG